MGDLLQEEISLILLQKVRDPRLEGLTVTAVEVSADLKKAHVYVSSLGGLEERRQALKGLKKAEGFLRHELASRISLRVVPEIIFHWDESLERGQRIEELLHQLGGE